MIDIETILDQYRKHTTVYPGNGCIFVSPPFFHTKSDDGLLIKITENQHGLPVFSDCHSTEDYLELRDVDLSNYGERLEKIIKRFGLIHDGNVFRMTVPSIQDVYVELYLGYFIQALSIIANIDL